MLNLHDLAVRAICAATPVKKNRIVFESYYGRGYSDSPKAICEALLKSGEDLDLVWLCRDDEAAKSLPAGVRAAPSMGPGKIRALASARVWVDNCRKYEHFKRKGQFYLQTWHGFALRKIEADASASLENEYLEAAKKDSAQCDLIVSGSRHMTRIYRQSFWYDGEVLETGTPRNDVFFHSADAAREKVRGALGLDKDRKLVLYAPTFRTDLSLDAYGIDTELVLRKCKERFGGEWSILVRLHPLIASASAGLFPYDGRRIVDATEYPDMQELLCTADLLITDFSSSMFDFALTGKPVLQFATDLEEYRKDRDFYFPIDSLPFPLARSNGELETAVTDLTQPGENSAWTDFVRETGICEDGNAAGRCAELILKQVKGL